MCPQAVPHSAELATGDLLPADRAEPAPATYPGRVREMPLIADALWPVMPRANANIEKSLSANHQRALAQVATDAGTELLASVPSYRLIKFARVRRNLFPVDRGNFGRQIKKAFEHYVSPSNRFKFGEEYIVRHLNGNQLDRRAFRRWAGTSPIQWRRTQAMI